MSLKIVVVTALMLLAVSAVLGRAVQYKITYSILNHKWARSRDPQSVYIQGSNGETAYHRCDANFNVINQDVVCVFESDIDIGDYRCVFLRTGGRDGLDLKKVSVQIDGIETHTIVPQGWDANYISLDDGETKKFCKVVDGGWSEFGEWSVCSAECGGGSQSRSKTCTNPSPANGGQECEGEDEESRTCNTEACPEPEKVCPTGYALCWDGQQCINAWKVCDGDVHCADGSDESNCAERVCDAGTTMYRRVKCADRMQCIRARDAPGDIPSW
ncbi:low-density lipoprotein receptor-related protein 1-like [Bolinopsis microptera]|uniref:low-density lipoprotein receptor-related protein 1-like n=1 Tax=Bolinopsis microptera TaxID=2820187 RepID=UPI00307958BB